MLLITGPNMGGKSLHETECAIALLAHVGAFVQARCRPYPPYRIFTALALQMIWQVSIYIHG